MSLGLLSMVAALTIVSGEQHFEYDQDLAKLSVVRQEDGNVSMPSVHPSSISEVRGLIRWPCRRKRALFHTADARVVLSAVSRGCRSRQLLLIHEKLAPNACV